MAIITTMEPTNPAMSTTSLPLSVQLAFAGTRELFDRPTHPSLDAAAFNEAALRSLIARLEHLPAELGLSERHTVCAVSSLAVGADTLFARACRALGWSQRVFLPQPTADFLQAVGSEGPDFSPADAATARELLASPHVIEERVASVSAKRRTRFEDVNLELVRVCDVVVCLVRAAGAAGKPGGTLDVLALAERHHRPALQIGVSVDAGGKPVFDEAWHWNAPPHAPPARQSGFVPPGLPAPLQELVCSDCDLTDPAKYRNTLKTFASAKAAEKRQFFTRAALVIVVTHVLATALALRAVQDHASAWVPWLLGAELSVLALGWGYHEWLHKSEAARVWALARLTAEVARSVIPLSGVPLPLRHLFELPMPAPLLPLLRTLNVLHLQGLRGLKPEDWTTRRDSYVNDRLNKKNGGQLGYYGARLADADRWLRRARVTFYVGSLGALVVTTMKLGVMLHWWHVILLDYDTASAVLGFLAVILPTIAVAALSLAAAFDLEARLHTYSDMLDFLEPQTRLLETAVTENEFATLALETETRLLGETANWHARRAFTGVA